MKRFVKLCAVSCLALTLGGGMAVAEQSKRRPNFFEQLFGGRSYQNDRIERPDRVERKRERRIIIRRGADDEGGFRLFGNSSRKKAKVIAVVADDDPEGDPGIGMGNLRYAAPRLVPLAGLTLAEARPADASAAPIYDQLSGAGPALKVLPAARDAILAEYTKRNFRPVWIENGTLSERGKAVLALLAAAGEEGLEPAAYLPPSLTAFDAPLPAQDQAAMARLDIDLFAAAVRYARDASGGVFDPRKLSLYNDVTPPWVAADKAARVLAWTPYAAEYLKSLEPTHPAYAAMKAALAELRAGGRKAGDPIPEGPIVKSGGSDPRIPLVRERLVERGYAEAAAAEGADPEKLDKELSVQLRLFQKASRIKVTGALGPQTLAALNADHSAAEADKLVDNMERLRWLPRDMGQRHVFVNQAAFEAKVMQNGEEQWSTRVIVGKPNTQTAVFSDEMELVVFNPSWGVPPSIIAKEYLPKLRRDPSHLDREGFKVVTDKGQGIPSRAINWSGHGSKVPFGIQQPPGAKNALGEIKFLFPNSHNIYMHDTPSRDLFKQDVRAFSHGCVRVQNPREFASVLLGWSAEKVDANVKTPGSETVRLKQKIPVHLTYFTAWPDETGKIRFYDDLYGRDKAMEDARSSVALAQR